MFRKVPTITRNDCYLKDGIFNFSFYLEGMLSSLRTDITKYGLIIHQSANKIQNYKPLEYVNNKLSNIIFLENKSPKINNNKATFVQNYSSSYEAETVYLYVTTIKYNPSLEQNSKNLTYFFGNTLEIPLKINNSISSTIVDYSVIQQILAIKPEQLSAKELTSFAISDLYTTFIDYRKIKNFMFLNHNLLCQRKNLNITKILNYRSLNIKKLLKPIIVVTRQGKKIQHEASVFNNRFDYISFEDKYEQNIKYEIKINYDISSISNFISDLIQKYKSTNSKDFEVSLLSSLNIEQSIRNTYFNFINNYDSSNQKQEYTLLPFFESILQYCDLVASNYDLPVSKSPSKTTDDAVIINKSVQVPFDSDKYFDVDEYQIIDSDIVVKPTKYNFNGIQKNQIKSNKQLYNILLANQLRVNEPIFNSILDSKSISITRKQKSSSNTRNVISNDNLIEDYKITNQKVTINDVFTRFPTDEPKQIRKTQEQQDIDNEQIRNITHKMFGTIDNYLKSDNLKLNYYLQYAIFNPLDLKNLEWNKLTIDVLRNLNQNNLLFVRLIPDFSDVNVKQDIFKFSYNINQIIKVQDLLQNVS